MPTTPYGGTLPPAPTTSTTVAEVRQPAPVHDDLAFTGGDVLGPAIVGTGAVLLGAAILGVRAWAGRRLPDLTVRGYAGGGR